MTTHAYPIDSPLKTATERGFAKIHTVDEAAAAFQGKVASEKGRREEADGEFHAMLRDDLGCEVAQKSRRAGKGSKPM